MLVAQSCPTLCDPLDCSPPGSSVPGIFQTRIQEWIAKPSSRGSSPPRDGTRVSCIPCTGRWVLHHHHHLGSRTQRVIFSIICNWFWKMLVKLIIYLNTCFGFPIRQMHYVRIMTDFLQSFLHFSLVLLYWPGLSVQHSIEVTGSLVLLCTLKEIFSRFPN